MKKLILALIITFAVSSLGFAAVQNIKVSGDISAQAITRDLSLGLTGTAKDSEDFLISQIRVRFDADLTENVSAVVQLLNERLWGAENETTSDTGVDLDLGYIVMKNFIYDPLTVTIGRQNLRFGRGLIVGDPDTDNQVSDASALYGVADDLSLRKSFDAIRATLDFSPLTLDIIYAKVKENATNVEDDVDLYGFNANYEVSDNTTVEGYLFVKDKDQGATSAGHNNDKVYTVGIRGETTAINNLTLYGEYAYQFGREYQGAGKSDLSRDAFAAQVGADYALKDSRNTVIGLCYTYLSGDDDSNDSDQDAWDPMFEDQKVGEIANLLFNNTNLQYVKLSVGTDLRQDIRLGLDYYYLRLAEKLSGSTMTGASSVISNNEYAIDSSEKDIGNEIDLSLKYDYTEDVQLGMYAGIFLPGDLFDNANDSTAYSVRGTVSVDF